MWCRISAKFDYINWSLGTNSREVILIRKHTMFDQKSLMEENSNINWFIVFYVCFVFLSMVAIRDVIDISLFFRLD